MVQTLQQMISLQVIGNSYTQHLIVQDNEVIVGATKVLKVSDLRSYGQSMKYLQKFAVKQNKTICIKLLYSGE